MKFHRFFGNFDFSKQHISITDKNQINRIKNVLRLSAEDTLYLCDGKENEALSKITLITRDRIELDIKKTEKNTNEPKTETTLYCAIIKSEHFEVVTEKVTEIGIKRIVPVITKRTVKQNIRPERMQKIIKEAAEQSGRGVLPELYKPFLFKDALEDAQNRNKTNFFFDVRGEKLSFEQIENQRAHTLGLFIGPEGGWEETEIEKARQRKFYIVSLGPLTLRAETAAIVASYILLRRQ